MRIGITGYQGRVGSYLLSHYPYAFVPLECDVTDDREVRSCVSKVRPDIILHLASKSNVDFCEDSANEKLVTLTNVRGTFHMASVAERVGCKMIILSSAYVFDGKRLFGKYKEKERQNAINFYGLSKMGAESIGTMFGCKVIRSSYLFDDHRLKKVRVAYNEGASQSFPTFIKRSFIYLPHFAELLVSYCERLSDMPDVLHLAGNESVSWYEFMQDFFYYSGYDMNMVIPRNQEENGHAPRGRNLGLDVSLSEKLGFPQYSYMDGIRELVK